jgi:hypothetical protein
LLEPFLEEFQIEEAQDDDVVHTYCRTCYPRDGVIQIAHCGKDISNERPVRGWDPSEECAMCVLTKELQGNLCKRGHVLYGK